MTGSPGTMSVLSLCTINRWTATRSRRICGASLFRSKGVLNENHCAETSDKVREVFDMKRRNGEHIGSFAAYGYVKDPNDKNALSD